MNDEVPGYRILQQVGEGGFSLVYRARQERLDRIVALKVLSVNAVDDATLRRFQRECQITGRLTGHPNVVTVLDTGMTKAGRPYIAMDFFEHGSLRDRLTREGPFPVSDILRIGVKICGALAATHQAEVLHRDVKPQNILVSRYGEPALADFGVARLVDTFEATHTNAFTPHHAAPEVVNGRPPGVSSDIYSLGSTLYQLLAGAPAFKGTTDTGIGPLMLRIINEPPPVIHRPDLPPRVFEAIQISMAKEPADRFRTAVDFAARLQQLQSELGLPVTELAGSGALTGPPYASGSGGPHGSTGPSSGFPGLAGTFPGPGEYVGFPAPGEGVTADPLEHSAFKQLNPGLYPAAPRTPRPHEDVPGGWGPRHGPGGWDQRPAPGTPQPDGSTPPPGAATQLGAPSPADFVGAPPTEGEPPAGPGAPSPTDLGGTPSAYPAAASPSEPGILSPTDYGTVPPAPGAAPLPHSDGASPSQSSTPSPTDRGTVPPAPGAAPLPHSDGASRTQLGAASSTQSEAAHQASFSSAPPASPNDATYIPSDEATAAPPESPTSTPQPGPNGTPQARTDNAPQARPDGAPQARTDGTPPGRTDGGRQARSDGVPQVAADGAPQAGPDGGRQVGADGARQGRADGALQAGPDGALQAGPDGARQAALDGTPQVGTDGAPRARPDGTPQGRTDGTPQAPADGAAQAGPDGARQAAFDGEPRTNLDGISPVGFDGAAHTQLDGAPSNGASSTHLDGVSPTRFNGSGHLGGMPPAPPDGAPHGPFIGRPPAWGPVGEGGPWLRQQAPTQQARTQQAPTQQAMSSSPPPTSQPHLVGSSRESTPRTLPPTQDVPPPSDSDGRTGSGGVLLGVVVAVLVVLGLGIGGLVILGGGKKPAPKAAPSTPAAQPLASAPPVDPATMNAVRPHGLRVHDAGTLVTLSWQLGKKGKTVPLLIQQSQADQTAKSLPLTVANGTTSAPIAGLDPTAGYCFEVGAIAAFSTKSGQPAAVAWSAPTCIRGAQPQH